MVWGVVRKCLLFILKKDPWYIKNQNPVEYKFSKQGSTEIAYITLGECFIIQLHRK